MNLSFIDYASLLLYFVIVFSIGIYFSRKQETTTDFFLAGRKLSWWIIGSSLIAANISTEHFVGMSGSGYQMGLAISSYEWLAAITLVLVGKYLLPVFIKHQIYTMPQFLEIRYNHVVRAMLSIMMMFGYTMIALASVLYAGGLAIHTLFNTPLIASILFLSLFSCAYTTYGGLRAVVYTDIVHVVALILGGLTATYFGIKELGGFGELFAQAGDKFHMVLPLNHPELPWLGVFIGLWIPNIYYWGCNQFITQRTLAAKSIEEAQKGVVFAGYLKLLIPLIVVIPGITAYTLYHDVLPRADMAYPYLIKQLIAPGFRGIIFAALVGATVSTLDSLLNSCSTIFTLDIYKRYIKKDSSEKHFIFIGRMTTIVAIIIATIIAPRLINYHLIFSYIQKFWGFISPGVVTVFLFGIFWRRATTAGAIASMSLSIPAYMLLQYVFPSMAFLNQMTISLIILSLVMVTVSLIWKTDSVNAIDFAEYKTLIRTPALFNRTGLILIGIVVGLYIVFF
jgi:solute:Na+ symporter, SSS family